MGDAELCQYTVQWVDTSSDERGFAVFMEGNEKPLAVVLQNQYNAHVNLEVGTSANLYVVAFNSYGSSLPSSQVAVTPSVMYSVSIDLTGGTLNGEYSPLLFVADGSLLELSTTPVPGYGFAGFYYDSLLQSLRFYPVISILFYIRSGLSLILFLRKQ